MYVYIYIYIYTHSESAFVWSTDKDTRLFLHLSQTWGLDVHDLYMIDIHASAVPVLLAYTLYNRQLVYNPARFIKRVSVVQSAHCVGWPLPSTPHGNTALSQCFQGQLCPDANAMRGWGTNVRSLKAAIHDRGTNWNSKMSERNTPPVHPILLWMGPFCYYYPFWDRRKILEDLTVRPENAFHGSVFVKSADCPPNFERTLW